MELKQCHERDETTMTGNTASTKLRQRRKVSNITEQFLSDREMLPHRKNVTKQVLKFKRQKCIHPLIGTPFLFSF